MKKGLIVCFILILLALSAYSEVEEGKVVKSQRYCEILELQFDGIFGILSEVSLDVWNTAGLNDCPQESWDALSLPITTIRNGPRYWLMDNIQTSGKTKEYIESAEVRDWGNLVMFKIATVRFPSIFSLLERLLNRFYAITEVDRETDFIWNVNSKVHTLFNGTHTWVMQSYIAPDPSATRERLDNLGSLYRKLPSNFRYETCYLSEELHVKANGKAYVMQDELLNSFQLYSTPAHLCSHSPSSRATTHDEL